MVGRIRDVVRALVALGVTTTGAEAGPGFDQLIVFGDSLSDTGNAGRFSNGPVWVEHMAGQLEVSLTASRTGGSNFAVGGARLAPESWPSSLRAQVDAFLRAPRFGARTLTVVYGGGNDLLAAVGRSDAPAMVDAAAASLRSIVSDLIAAGASDLLVPNLPDIGITPEIRARGPLAVGEAARLTDRFNARVDRALAEIAGSAPRPARIRRLDVREMAERARRNPASFGFSDVSAPCRGLATCEGHLFWDNVHPTTQAHGRLAEAAFRAVWTASEGR